MKGFDKKYLNMLREVAITQFKLKDQSTFFGFIWSFFQPLIMLIIIYLVFRPKIGSEVGHYGIYVLVGVVHYTHFATATSKSMQVLHSMKQLITDTIFPKEVLVIGSVLSNTIDFVLSMMICIVMAFFSGVHISWTICLLPLIIILQTALVLWVSLIISFLFIFIRDIGNIYQVFLRLLFFITPIFYTTSFIGKGIANSIVLLNPLTHIVAFSRLLIIQEDPFPIKPFLLLLLINTVLIYFSLKLFKQLEPAFAENV